MNGKSLYLVHPSPHSYYHPQEHITHFDSLLTIFCHSDSGHPSYNSAHVRSFGLSAKCREHSYLGNSSSVEFPGKCPAESVRSYHYRDPWRSRRCDEGVPSCDTSVFEVEGRPRRYNFMCDMTPPLSEQFSKKGVTFVFPCLNGSHCNNCSANHGGKCDGGATRNHY